MLDPFPIPAPPFLAAFAQTFASYLNLDALPVHIHEVMLACIFYQTIGSVVSPWISSLLCPRTYPKLSPRSRLNWDVHVVSLVQSLLINYLALWVMFNDAERKHMDWKERVWGYTGASGMIQGLAMGYFVWDLWISLRHVDIFGLGLLAHAFSALYVFSMGYRPFANYYAPNFILYELSSPFLNFHWFFDKLDMTGSNAQLFNGILLMSSFFGSRLVWGPFQTYRVFKDVFKALSLQETAAGRAWLTANAKYAEVAAKAGSQTGSHAQAQVMQYSLGKHVPVWYAYTFLGSNIVLTLLNVFWFGKMIETIRKRFDPPFGTRQPSDKKASKDEVVLGRGLEADGTKTVEIDAKDVRKRRGPKNEDTPPPS